MERHKSHLTHKITQAGWKVLAESIAKNGLRHATTSCIAPTGTISIIAGASGGIEPVFALVFTRNIMDNTRLLESHTYFQQVLSQNGLDQDVILRKVAEAGSVKDIDELDEQNRRLFVTSFDITPDWHVKMQAAWQEFSDNGVSKTINFPEAASREDVAKAYHMAYELGIKGITTYRNNSRQDQPMVISRAASGKSEQFEQKTDSELPTSIVCVDCD
jgi:ribonucleoside-diphosphate reductase alpha chain